MKFSVDPGAFTQGVESVQNVAETSLANPMIENILITASDGKVVFAGTNLSVSIKCEVAADVQEAGSVAIPARFLASVAREIPAGVVDICADPTKLTLRCARAVFHIGCLPADDFPEFSEVQGGTDVTLPGAFLKKSLRRTLFATTNEEKRYELDGVKFEFTASECRLIATDGRRLSMIKHEHPFGVAETKCLAPTRALSEVGRIFPEDQEVRFRIGDRKVMFSCGGVTLTSTLLNDNFPPYEQIIPRNPTILMTLPRRSFQDAVRRVAVMANEKNSLIRLTVKEGIMTVNGERQQVGDATDEVEVAYKGDPFEVGYQGQYLLDMIKIMESDEIQAELVDPGTAGIFRQVGEPGFLHLVMPVRLERRNEIASETNEED